MKWFKLGLSQEELKAAYRELAKKYHPDMTGGSTVIMQEINDEYESYITTSNTGTDDQHFTYSGVWGTDMWGIDFSDIFANYMRDTIDQTILEWLKYTHQATKSTDDNDEYKPDKTSWYGLDKYLFVSQNPPASIYENRVEGDAVDRSIHIYVKIPGFFLMTVNTTGYHSQKFLSEPMHESNMDDLLLTVIYAYCNNQIGSDSFEDVRNIEYQCVHTSYGDLGVLKVIYQTIMKHDSDSNTSTITEYARRYAVYVTDAKCGRGHPTRLVEIYGTTDDSDTVKYLNTNTIKSGKLTDYICNKVYHMSAQAFISRYTFDFIDRFHKDAEMYRVFCIDDFHNIKSNKIPDCVYHLIDIGLLSIYQSEAYKSLSYASLNLTPILKKAMDDFALTTRHQTTIQDLDCAQAWVTDINKIYFKRVQSHIKSGRIKINQEEK